MEEAALVARLVLRSECTELLLIVLDLRIIIWGIVCRHIRTYVAQERYFPCLDQTLVSYESAPQSLAHIIEGFALLVLDWHSKIWIRE